MAGALTAISARDENASLFPGGKEFYDLSGTGVGPWIPTSILVGKDGTSTLVINSDGSINVNATLAALSQIIATGLTASGVALSANPLTTGGLAKTALPTAVADAQVVNAMLDKFGRAVVLPVTIRDLVGTQTTTISASTVETTIVTQAANVFNDLVMLIVSNTSASTNTRIDFRDTTSGSILFSLESVGGGAPVGFAVSAPIPQTSVNTNWTAQCATSTTDIRIYAVFAKNK